MPDQNSTQDPNQPVQSTTDPGAVPVTIPFPIPTETDIPPIPAFLSGTPSDLPPMVTDSPKKKFGGGKIIATILGFFLLVGGIAGGVILTQQQQDIREKAGSCAANPCGPGLECDGSGGCRPRDSGDGYTGPRIEPPDEPWRDPDGDSISKPNDNGGCPAGTYKCGGTGLAFDFCLSESLGKSCNESAYEQGYTVPIGSGIGGIYGSGTWFCKTPPPGGASCDGKNGGVLRNDLNANSCFCGVLQVDTPTGFKSYKNNCGCKGDNDEAPAVTTTTTTPTAQCQNIKAYSPTWTLLTNTQLSALTTGSQVNFCVVGSASSGTFDKAKFTVNGVAQAETSTIRPTSTDFCQLYTIPAGTTTFNVTAQIHHVTLGWK